MSSGKKKTPATRPPHPGRLIDARIKELGGWRGEMLARVRAIITRAAPGIVEEWKWDGPVWSGPGGIICTGEAYKATVKLTFARGASLPDPDGLFNSSLAGNTRRAIDLREGDAVNAPALKSLVKAACAPRLLSGGNPQIAKAEGDAPVRAYLAALPGWKRDVGEQLDRLIVRTVPKVRKAVKWNSPFYGLDGWFLGFHAFAKAMKVTFFRGTSLRPPPPGGKAKEARWIDIREHEPFDEAQLADWIRQASRLPGWNGTSGGTR